ncbi:MAG TPA: hypothetical protein VI455_07835, partial [Terriglobia bacterium]
GSADEAKPAAEFRDLEHQVQELNAALQQMRTEIEEARGQATELRQELRDTSDQVRVLKSELAETRNPAKLQPEPVLPAAEASQNAVQQLATRVSKVEDGQQLLDAKVDDQYQTKVESGSKYRVRLSGMALFNAFSTRGATDEFDVPGYAMARDPSQPSGGFGATVRQSILGLDVFGPTVAGATTHADIRADFFGGFTSAPDGVTAGIFRLRTAGLQLNWQNTSIVAGQYTPFFSPLSPTSLASVGYPAMADSGNLWVWTPQVYVERRLTLSDGSKVSFQGGILDSLTGEVPPDPYYREPQAGERSGQPAYAARIAWINGSQSVPFSVGVGGYYARQNWGFGRTVDAWAGTADWSLPMSHGFSLTGEFYRGRALGGLGAAEGRSIVVNGPLLNPQTEIYGADSTGGWAQLKFTPSEKIEFNGAFGEDFSPDPGLQYAAGGATYGPPIGRNATAFFNTIYHVRSNVMFSVEYRRLRTAETQPGLYNAGQVSLSAATLF